jgi:hypothetical protein
MADDERQEQVDRARAGIEAFAAKHGVSVDATLKIIGDPSHMCVAELDAWAKAIGDSAIYWETTAQVQLDAVAILGNTDVRKRLHRANILARDNKIELVDAAVLVTWDGGKDGRVLRWSRVSLDLAPRQHAAIDRALAEAE